MIIQSFDNNISFGKLSDRGVLDKSKIYQNYKDIKHFTNKNFQYIVDNIADMYGYKHGIITADVEEKDYVLAQNQKNDLLEFRFTMNAQINTYMRTSCYGKHFMHYAAQKYGYPAIFGIVAHEIGHLVTNNALNVMATKIINGQPALVVTKSVNCYWDELCSDYLAGITLSKASPKLSEEPLCEFLKNTEGGKEHPDGYWRVLAVKIGCQWGINNSQILTNMILSQTDKQQNLLINFQKSYYEKIFQKTSFFSKIGKTILPPNLMENDNIILGYI